MTLYQLDYKGKNGCISTEYECDGVEELLDWANDEFAEELGGEEIRAERVYVSEVIAYSVI